MIKKPACDRGVPEKQIRIHAVCDGCSKRDRDCLEYQLQQAIEDASPVRCAHCGRQCEGVWVDKAGELICTDCKAGTMEMEGRYQHGFDQEFNDLINASLRQHQEGEEETIWFIKQYEQLGKEIGAMTDKKQAAYGDSFGKSGDVLRILYPDGIKPDQYDDVLAITRIVDKLFRIATDKNAFGESPFQDICGYSLLGAGKSRINPFQPF